MDHPLHDDPLRAAASSYLGVDYLFPYQRLVIQTTIEAYEGTMGEEIPRQIVLLPTGAGKSLCFFLPAALLPGLTLVVYPLKALIRDQERRLASTGIRAGALSGDQTPEARRHLLRTLDRGQIDMLLTNPETLSQTLVREALKKHGVTHLVVDEAHCIVDWGKTFRPAYLTLSETIRVLEPRIVSAYTATASPEVLRGIRSTLFGNEATHLVRGNPDRPNIHYSVLPVLSKSRALATLLRASPNPGIGAVGLSSLRPAVVFTQTRHEAESTCRTLRASMRDTAVRFYHAGLTAAERETTEAWFNEAPEGVLVATCAYGMGVDKKGIRAVVHRDLPQTVERYLQEAGRAGRDGEPAAAILLTTPEEGASGERKKGMAAYPETRGCRREYLLSLLGADLKACTGCDRCDGTARDQSALLGTLERAIAENPRRFSTEEVETILSGRLRRLTELYGLMSRWQPEEREEAVAALLRSGAVRVIEKGPWKGRLTRRATRRKA
jgi:ATP-dependent DNA helicase RecQ